LGVGVVQGNIVCGNIVWGNVIILGIHRGIAMVPGNLNKHFLMGKHT
jgi:hypothetical protein